MKSLEALKVLGKVLNVDSSYADVPRKWLSVEIEESKPTLEQIKAREQSKKRQLVDAMAVMQ